MDRKRLQLVSSTGEAHRLPQRNGWPDQESLSPTQRKLVAYFEARLSQNEAQIARLTEQLRQISTECPIARKIKERNGE